MPPTVPLLEIASVDRRGAFRNSQPRWTHMALRKVLPAKVDLDKQVGGLHCGL